LAGKETVPEDALMVTGLDMWEDDDGKGDGGVYWRGCVEFSHLGTYRVRGDCGGVEQKEKGGGLKERIRSVVARGGDRDSKQEGGGGGMKEELEKVVMDAFLLFLAGTLAFAAETFEVGEGLGVYGLDSLNAVAVQYWCWREVGVDVSVDEVFGARSIHDLVEVVCVRVVVGLDGSGMVKGNGSKG
ncbi:MAG: hypothetical protein Q9172_005774, partial [Xanthocarpia lactea]